MKSFSTTILALLFGILPLASVFSQSDNPRFVSESAALNRFPLVNEVASPIVFDGTDEGVLMAVKNLQEDIQSVSGKMPGLLTKMDGQNNIVLIGQLGESEWIDQLVLQGQINISSLANKWETFQIQTIQNPFPGINQALVIVGSDKRGTIFGIYELSKQIGVSPWNWWADVPVKNKKAIFINHGLYSKGTPAVKYRGIFINDEAPALSGWAHEKFGGFNHQFYGNVFELILRLHGNYLWPAMWGRAFYDDDPLNGPLADQYGIVIGTSHHEPMMRAHAEWSRYGKGDWNYQSNKETLQEFWKTGLERQRNMEATVSLGMRGDGDEPMSEENNIALLEKIIEDQRKIIEDVTGKPASETPQFWALYKEVQEYYEKGMRVPDDVMLLLCDDNWGNVRKLPAIGAKPRKGGYGMYYHFDYVGGPRNYKWINTNPLPKIWEQMNRTYQHGVDELWVVNVGDIKPMEFPISFFLDFAWNPDAIPVSAIADYTHNWAEAQFGAQYAAEIGTLLSGFGKLSGRRKPELLDQKSYSIHFYDEMTSVSKEWKALEELSALVKSKLDAKYLPAYYQLVEHPIIASANLHRLYESTALNHLYFLQGRMLTNTMAADVKAYFKKDSLISDFYNNILLDGKWSHMMDQTHIGYTYWQEPKKNAMPELKNLKMSSPGNLGVAISESTSFFPETKQLKSVELSPFDVQKVKLELFNRGGKPMDFKIMNQTKWLKTTVESGLVETQIEILIEVDWTLAPKGRQISEIEIVSGKDKVKVQIPMNNYTIDESFKGFIESFGVVSIEADHFTTKHEVNPVRWQVVPDLGKTGNSIMATPEIAFTESDSLQGSFLTYDVWFEEAGEYEVNVLASPTLNYLNTEEGIRYGLAVNENEPILVSIHENENARTWDTWVANSINITKRKMKFEKGPNQLKLYMVNPGVVFQKLIIDAGGLQQSYLGPKESFYKF
ncbi:glycosyhydrolase [Rhodonellum psychrophilum GCM71 = DSM 17998]|uniref:Glycosyhydrolase n=2 Tax=Rhodonellum TaxID=336827 RepID=U5C3T9_9BACT|nr:MULTISPECIES: glycosyl hydrolase 115 family protein [Rhodonellum]ERM83591.1 glycosyhydrolase [Rhodonellum psychrophilum GCM71 = DSM 17998]SDY49082.1 Glycosyl hydrolase family 67 N-terminus [Rhodonellum ikkaensis]